MSVLTVNFDSIELFCRIRLNQIDNVDQGFEIELVQLMTDSTDIKNILDQDKLIKLIYEQLK